jgi:predicted SAM-dependent methyltransferase
MLKLHLGCGTIYLENYINVDANPDFISTDNVDFEENKTTLDNYYKHKWGNSPKRVVADLKAEINDLPYEDGEVDEIIIIHVLEHIPLYEVDKNIAEVNRVLKAGGNLYVAVPDLKGFAKEFAVASEEKDEWYVRCIHGTQRTKWDHHYCGYTHKTLKNLLRKHGFGNFKELKNINFYPAIHINCSKI